MKTITLYQPWATLVAIGEKRIETRSWNTKYRGKLAIHAGKNTKFVNGKSSLLQTEPFHDVLMNNHLAWDGLPMGCIIATCNLVHVEKIETQGVNKSYLRDEVEWMLTEQETSFGDYTVGRYMWFLKDIDMLSRPFPINGNMGFWEWNADKV